LVLGLAIWLLIVATSLTEIEGKLNIVIKAVTGIAGQTKPAPGVVGAVARDVGAIQGALHGLIALATGGAAPAPAAPARATAPPARGPRSSLAAEPSAARGGNARRTPPSLHNRH
jgi:hypothetical protein